MKRIKASFRSIVIVVIEFLTRTIEEPIVLSEEDRPVPDRGLSRKELKLFRKWGWDSSMSVCKDDSHGWLTNKQLVCKIMEAISGGGSINRLLTEYERRLNAGKGGKLEKRDEVTTRDLLIAMVRLLDIGEYFHLETCPCLSAVSGTPICLLVVEGIMKEILSDLNRHGTRVRFSIPDEIREQMLANYVITEAMGRYFTDGKAANDLEIAA